MSAVAVCEEYPKVRGTPTCVLKCGDININKMLILIIPGNPGHAGYYSQFVQALYLKINEQIPVWCVSHAGHGLLPASAGPDENKVSYYGLKDQIRHKLCYVQDYIPGGTRLILIGHSIGCYIILQMMKELQPSVIYKAMLLFPTIERMALSESGRRLAPIIKYLRFVAPLIAFPLYYLTPAFIKNFIICWYFRKKNVSPSAVKSTQLISNPASIKNIISMAAEEMADVCEADHDIIEKNMSKIMFYYGAKDHWCPTEYYEDMKFRHPLADVQLCEHGYDHAFVLTQSYQMASVCSDWLKKCPDFDISS